MLSEKERGIVRNWTKQIEIKIQDKEPRKRGLREEVEKLKIEVKIDIPRRVKELIEDAMTLGTIEIEGVKKPCPSDIGEYIDKVKEEGKNIRDKLETKEKELASLELEIIIDHQRLIVLKTDLEEK